MSANGFYLIGQNTTASNLTMIAEWATEVDDLNAQYLMEPGRYKPETKHKKTFLEVALICSTTDPAEFDVVLRISGSY